MVNGADSDIGSRATGDYEQLMEPRSATGSSARTGPQGRQNTRLQSGGWVCWFILRALKTLETT